VKRIRRLALLATGLLVAATACSGGDEDGGTTVVESGAWSFTDDRGHVVTLDAPPDVIVAQSVSAGGLWEYGVEVDGVFGPLRRPDGDPDPAIGLADPDDFASVGEIESEVDLEAVAEIQPDVIVTQLWGDGTLWGIDDELDELESLAPIIAIRVGETSMDEPLAELAELAGSIGGADARTKVDEAETAFDAASERLSAALEAKPDLQVVAASGTLSEMYVAYPPGFPDLHYYQSQGMDLAEPEEHPTAGGYWETLSWEQADKYPADLILADVRGATLEQLVEQMPPTAAALPAVESEQVIAWPASFALGYGNVAEVIDLITAAVVSADPAVAD
jgi:iron complex transport system substrate-binding protein